MVVVAGVDVAKSSLDVSVCEGPVLQFDNSAKGITKLLNADIWRSRKQPWPCANPPAGMSVCWSAAYGRPK